MDPASIVPHDVPPAPISQTSMLSSPFLLSVPPELQLNIFRHLDSIQDVTALASTCRALHSLMESGAGSVIRVVAQRYMLAFDDALRAVRASLLTLSANGPHFDFGQGKYVNIPSHSFCEDLAAAHPTLGELRMIYKLMMLVENWQAALDVVYTSLWVSQGFDDTRVQERFHRGAYRFLFLGYLFSGVYLEPLMGRSWPISHDDKIRSYPIYHDVDPAWRSMQIHGLFEGFISWIVADGAKRGITEDLCNLHFGGPQGDNQAIPHTQTVSTFDAEAHGSIREVLLLLTLHDLYHEFRLLASQAEIDSMRETSTVMVTTYPFGRFNPETMIIPNEPSDLPLTFLNACEKYRLPVRAVLATLFASADRAYPRALEFFYIALKERFGLQIHPNHCREQGYECSCGWLMSGGVLYDGGKEEMKDRGEEDEVESITFELLERI